MAACIIDGVTNLLVLGAREGRPGQGHRAADGAREGHTTLDVYTQVVDGSLRGAADTVGSELVTIVPNRKMMMAGASMVMGLPSRSS